MSTSRISLVESIVLCTVLLAIALVVIPSCGSSEPDASDGTKSKPGKVITEAMMTKDANNLRIIYQAIMVYSSENNSAYPAYARQGTNAVGFDPALRAKGLYATHSAVYEDTGNNMTAALWRLVLEKYTTADSFVNPASDDTPDTLVNAEGKDKDQYGNIPVYDFSGPQHLSYSFINFYHDDVRRHWSMNMGPTYVMAGNDNNSAFSEGLQTDYSNLTDNASMNSTDMQGKGQNMLFGDGHTEFVSHPAGAFNQTDNVYTWHDEANSVADLASVTELEKKNNQLITSTSSGKTVLQANVRKDVFLIPVEALKK